MESHSENHDTETPAKFSSFYVVGCCVCPLISSQLLQKPHINTKLIKYQQYAMIIFARFPLKMNTVCSMFKWKKHQC